MEPSKGMIVNHRKKIFAGFLVFTIAVVALVVFYLGYRSTHIATDDAFVEGKVHIIAPKVSGNIVRIHVEDNQLVKPGDLLFEIDEADYDVKVSEAESVVHAEKSKVGEARDRIDVAEKQLEEKKYRVEAAKANLALQEARLKLAEVDLRRAEELLKEEVVSRSFYDKAKTAHDVAQAQYLEAQGQLTEAEAGIAAQRAVIRQARSSFSSQGLVVREKEAVLRAAALKKHYTRIFAPAGGYISKKTAQLGNQVQAGQPVMAVVPLDDIWIVANYKETQLEKVKPGQAVEIKVDTFPGRVFKGRVDSIMAGTGAVFSLFPPENATGNYVKVVQRVPVKIVLDDKADAEHVLRVGMSVVPTILVQ